MRSSRISIFLINTRCSRHKEVGAPFVGPFKTGDEVIFAEIFQKLLADPQLKIPERSRTLPDQILNAGGNVEAADVAAFRMQTGFVQPPLRNQTVGLERSVLPIK